MGKNKQQVATEARAKKTTEVQPQPSTEQPKAEVKATPATPAPAQPSKQEQTIAKLREGWTARGVDLSKLSIADDGKFKLAIVAPGWPTIRIGNSGGVTVMELKSYASAWEASMDGLNLYNKQKEREQKKTAAPAPTAPAPKAAPAEKQSVSA